MAGAGPFRPNLVVQAGQIICLLGGNASGKSTTTKVILGLVNPRGGRVDFAGETITGLPTPRIIRRGIASVPEARRLIPATTVRENLLMGAYVRRGKAEFRRDYERMLELFPRVAERIPDGPAEADLHGRADDGLVATLCGSCAGADLGDQRAGHNGLHGGAKR